MKISKLIIIPALLGCIGLYFSACKKRDDMPAGTAGPNLSPQTWMIDSTVYTTTGVGRLNNMFFANGPVGLITFQFASLPAASGSFTVGDPEAAAGNVGIEARTGEDYVGLSGTVAVSVLNGKIGIDAANIRMIHMPMGTDTVLLSARLYEW